MAIVKGQVHLQRWLSSGTEMLCMMLDIRGDALIFTICIVLSELQIRIPPHFLPKYDVFPFALCNYSENKTMESLRSQMDTDPTALLVNIFEATD